MVGGNHAELRGCPFMKTQHSLCHPWRHVQKEMQCFNCSQDLPSLVGSFQLLRNTSCVEYLPLVSPEAYTFVS